MTRHSSEAPVVLITGSSAGIGKATAHRFAVGGYRVVAVARGQDRLDQLARELATVTDIETVAVDIGSTGAADAVVGVAMERFGRLDCLVNNAGSFKSAAVEQTDDAMLDEVVDVSLKAPYRLCRAAVRVMRPGSSIINIGSTYGLVGGMNGGIYNVVKAALNGLTQSIAVDYGAQGIRSNLIAPGVIKTDMTKAFWDVPAFQRLNQERTPFNREGTVEDVANAVFFFASEEGSYFNGQIVALDGGWTTTKYLCPEALTSKRVAQ